MKTFMKKSLAVLLAIMMLSSAFVCFAANDVSLNEEAAAAHYGQYKNYLLLGDSAASGYRDVLEEDDGNDIYNKQYNQSVYTIVKDSYADIIGKAIGAETVKSFAAPGYRTIEMRYMLEDDYRDACEDPYLFTPSQLYWFESHPYEEGDNGYHAPGDEYFRTEMKNAIAEADLITIGIGGNDWGEYLKWVLGDILAEENVADEYIQDAKEILDKSTMPTETVATIVDIAHKAGALPALIEKLPKALEYGLGNFYTNWNYIVEDIYALNPDVTLMVMGMGDSGKKGYYYGYGAADEKIEVAEQDEATAKATEFILGIVLGIANGPLKSGAEKYGYTYVDTNGATFVTYHQDADGHVFIANKVIEALPNAEIFNMFTDMTPANKYYSAVEYVVANGLMTGREEGIFAPDAIMTKGEFAVALNKINGTDKKTDKTDDATAVHLMFAFLKGAFSRDFEGFFKTLALAMKVIADNDFDFGARITRADAAEYLQTYCTI